tara:strand:- start:1151 stop:1774 length:624 start_codon:yes stop_codon:yes gene_type:complete
VPFINLPPVVSEMFWDLDRRIRSLETAFRFNMPNVDFSINEPTNSRVGDLYYNTYANQVTYWNGTEWVVISDDNVGVPVIPFVSTWSGTGLAYTGTPAIGQYSRVGKMITFYILVTLTNVTNFGTGKYSLTLPSGFPSQMHAVINGGLHDTSTSNHLNLLGDLEPASLAIELYYPTSNGVNNRFDHNSPLTLATNDYFYISGTYFIS